MYPEVILKWLYLSDSPMLLSVHHTKEVSDSLAAVKKYVQKTGADQLKDGGIENIFKYVMPKSIFVPHTKKHRIAAIMCNYKFDMEHGIAVVFESGKLKKVGTQDIVL